MGFCIICWYEKWEKLTVDNSCFIQAIYRPYFKQNLYFNKDLNWSRCLQPLFFPNSQYYNLVICINGTGTNKEFCTLISDCVFDRQTLANNQCFPLYWYEENKNPQASLFDDAEANRYIRRDGITDWILKEIRNRFGETKAITKEHIFTMCMDCFIPSNTVSVSPMIWRSHCHAFP